MSASRTILRRNPSNRTVAGEKGARLEKIRVKPGTIGRRIIRVVAAGIYEHALHATKGWRKRRAT